LRITVYDAETRSQIATDQNRAALWSVDLAGANPSQPVELRFGPGQPADPGQPGIHTILGKGSFVHSRTYGPQEPTLNGDWTARLPAALNQGRPQWPRVQKLLMQFHWAGMRDIRD
jgi:hypothetical protein